MKIIINGSTYTFHLQQALKNLFLLIIGIIFCLLLCRVVRYPELYITTWKYQLYNDIQRGNEKAIEYYQTYYVDNGIVLFEGENNEK